jgi:hypothetical protein
MDNAKEDNTDNNEIEIPIHHRIMEWLLIIMSIAVNIIFFSIIIF